MIGWIILGAGIYSAETKKSVGNQPTDGKIWNVSFVNLKKQKVQLKCMVADTDETRSRGLMFRKSLGKDECMLFVFEEPRILTFWMKNTSIPLSIGYLNADMVLMEVTHMRPHDESLVVSTTEVQYAIETNKGWFHRNLVHSGAKAIVETSGH